MRSKEKATGLTAGRKKRFWALRTPMRSAEREIK
jgi:hypothetical protein